MGARVYIYIYIYIFIDEISLRVFYSIANE